MARKTEQASDAQAGSARGFSAVKGPGGHNGITRRTSPSARPAATRNSPSTGRSGSPPSTPRSLDQRREEEGLAGIPRPRAAPSPPPAHREGPGARNPRDTHGRSDGPAASGTPGRWEEGGSSGAAAAAAARSELPQSARRP